MLINLLLLIKVGIQNNKKILETYLSEKYNTLCTLYMQFVVLYIYIK